MLTARVSLSITMLSFPPVGGKPVADIASPLVQAIAHGLITQPDTELGTLLCLFLAASRRASSLPTARFSYILRQTREKYKRFLMLRLCTNSRPGTETIGLQSGRKGWHRLRGYTDTKLQDPPQRHAVRLRLLPGVAALN